MKFKIPGVIYLQCHDDDGELLEHNDEEVTWCEDNVDGHCVKFVRVSNSDPVHFTCVCETCIAKRKRERLEGEMMCRSCGQKLAHSRQYNCHECHKKWMSKRKSAFDQAVDELGPLSATNLHAIQRRIRELEGVGG